MFYFNYLSEPYMTSACSTSDFAERSLTLSWPAATTNLPVTYFYNYTTSLEVKKTNVTSTVVQGLSYGFNYSFKVWASINETKSDAVYCSGTTGTLLHVSFKAYFVGILNKGLGYS